MSWKEAEEYFSTHDLIILPIGSNEQHGPQNPLGTDFLIAEAIAEELAKRTGFASLRCIPYGVSFHHMHFPGTITVDEFAFMNYIYEVLKSLSKWKIKKVLIINGHGGNLNSLQILARKAREELNLLVFIFQWWSLKSLENYFNKDELGHAAAVETSLIAYLYPEWVNKQGAIDETPREREKELTWFTYTKEFTESGVFGVSKTFSRERGKEVFEEVLSHLVKLVEEIEKEKI
ncbi:MAG: creatininase family protein [Candidatus Brockarchaeota archaeon]|nr:creatininase family protein [Candidatus Brockarchaeota archaeon]